MSKMGLHDPFGHLKHNLWPKEKSGIKLAIWLSTTKSWESTWFPCVQVACDTLLESLQWGLQLCLKRHSDRRSATEEVIVPQSCGSSNLGDFETPKSIWMRAPRRGAKYTIWGKVVASPESGPWWVLWIRSHPWLVLAPKVLQLCINHFLLVLCKSV
jgi:hypothetical protein